MCPGRRSQFYPEVEARARSLGVDQTTWFPGFVSPVELRGLYSLSRALVFPSLFEGFGLPVVEAMASGTPVVVVPDPALVEVAGEAARQALLEAGGVGQLRSRAAPSA